MTDTSPTSTTTIAPADRAEAPRGRRPSLPPALRHTVLAAWPYAIAALLSLAAALWTYRPWRFGSALMVPHGDALAFAAWIQNITESGWYENGERLNAPYAQNSHSYTLTDELVMWAVGHVLAPLTGSTGAAITSWLVLTFPLAAVAGVALARYLRISPVTSVLVGVAFALLPDHFIRGTGHFALATTWVIPVALLGAVSLVHPPRHTGRRRVVWEAALLVALACVTLTSAYYAVFGGLLTAAAGVGAFVVRRRWQDLALTAGRGLALGVPLVVAVGLDRAFLPRPLGYESFAVTRSLADSEIYGGKITAMLLPTTAHRVPFLRDLRKTYDGTFPNPAEGPSLGLLATLGFLGLVGWAVLHYWRRGVPRDERIGTFAALTWVALLAYVVGGLGSVWALALDGGGIRVWSRMHVFIALLALLAVGVVVDRLQRWWRVGAVALLLAVVAYDQTSGAYRVDPVIPRAVQDEMRELTGRITARAGDSAMVYQYPEVTFPVQQRVTAPASAYDGFLPYLYSDTLRWSYGGLQGDPTADWQVRLGELPLPEQANLLAAAGFAGILVDAVALEASPEELEELALLGEPDVVSSSGRFRYHELDALPAACTGVARTLAGDMAVAPPLVYAGDGTGMLPGGRFVDDVDEPEGGELRIVTLREEGWVDATLELTVSSPQSAVRVHLPDGSTREVPAGDTVVTWTGDLSSEDTVRLEPLDATAPYEVNGVQTRLTTPAAAAACLMETSPAGDEG